MKRIINCLSVIILVCLACNAGAQSDSLSLSLARHALDVDHNCENALNFLKTVSNQGTGDPQYNLLMGRTQDCKMNNEQAIFYYSKYLDANPKNDSVRLRLAQLKDQDHRQTGNNSRDDDKHVSYHDKKQPYKAHKKKKASVIDDYFSQVGLSYIAGLGSNAPLRQGISLDVASRFPIAKTKATIDLEFREQFLFAPNTTWMQNTYELSPGDAANVNGFGETFDIGISKIFVNDHKKAFTAGVFVGFSMISLGVDPNSLASQYNVSSLGVFDLTYGIRANYHVGKSLVFSLKMNMNSVHTLTTGNDYNGNAITAPVDLSYLSLGIAYKFVPRGFWGYGGWGWY